VSEDKKKGKQESLCNHDAINQVPSQQNDEEEHVRKQKQACDKKTDIAADANITLAPTSVKTGTKAAEDVLADHADTQGVPKITIEEKRSAAQKQKMTLEEKRRGNPEYQTMEEKRKAQREQFMTLEEKRRKQRENKMTIEEKRKLQRKQNTMRQSSTISAYFKQLKITDTVCLICLVLCVVMNIYISLQMMRYVEWLYAGVFFVTVTLLISIVFALTVKRRKSGLIFHVILFVALMLGSMAAYRLHEFGGKLFYHCEQETVMIADKKDVMAYTLSYLYENKMNIIATNGNISLFVKER